MRWRRMMSEVGRLGVLVLDVNHDAESSRELQRVVGVTATLPFCCDNRAAPRG